jgi:hypothetical protein
MKTIKASKLNFIGAQATNTRLMGVVGVVVHWKDEAEREIAQIFHLDYEVYGIDGFYHLMGQSLSELDTLTLAVTGGLGGTFVPIDFREMVYLIKSAYAVDPNSIETHVDFEAFLETFLSWHDDLSLEEIVNLMEKINPPITTNIQAINYMIMRIVGGDVMSTISLWADQSQIRKTEFFETPFTLIKNTCHFVTDVSETTKVYRAEALIDFEHKYKLLVFKLSVNEMTHKIISVEHVEDLMISSIEAAFNLNKPEFMIVTQLKDAFFERRFADNNPEMMKQEYTQGQLYIEFNADNAHVSLNPYYLNGDIYAMYFFSRAGQLLIASFSKTNLEQIDSMLVNNQAYTDSLQFVCELKTDDPILYAYINSEYQTIFEFLSH